MGETKLEDILCHAEGNGALPAEGLLLDTDVMHVLHVLECFSGMSAFCITLPKHQYK